MKIKRKKSFGLGFGDELSKITTTGRVKKIQNEEGWEDSLIPNFNPNGVETRVNPWRITLLVALSLILFFVIFVRVFHLQITKGSENRELADGNRIQIKVIHAARGVIFDRNGQILAKNEPSFRLVEEKEGDRKITYISKEEALKMETRGDLLFNNLEIDHIRFYPLGEKSAHILGYVSEISAEELKDSKFTDYTAGDRIGRGGVEETYEKILKGVDGGEVVEVDAQGIVKRVIRKTEPTAGRNLYLSIDLDLQKKVYNILAEGIKKSGSCCAAAIVQDPLSGQILAMVSLPSFDPHQITPFLTDTNFPLLNRDIGGVYPPGSTFKVASSLAGLASGKITTTTQFNDTGEIFLGSFRFTNWYFTQYGKVEGQVDIIKALKRSNDTFFYLLGQQVGEEALGEVAKRLGMGRKLGIDVPGEEEGLIPNDGWKRKNIGEQWFLGDTLHMAIGQGYVLTTPLQINNLISQVAASGRQYIPYLALRIVDSEDKLINEFKSQEVKNHFQETDWALIRKGLEEVPKAGGTAWPFFNFSIPTAGKTGTAEYGDPKGRTHAWYTAFAPVENPEIAVTVLIEGGGEGSTVAAPVVKEIMRWYFSEDKNNLIKEVGPVATESARTLGE